MSDLIAARDSAASGGGKPRVGVISENGAKAKIINPPDRPTYLNE
jgi:hypothetical protein